MRAGILLALIAVGSLSCARTPMPGPEVVASVGGDEVLYSDFEGHVRSSVGESAAGLESAVLSRLLDRYLEERALARLARERGIEEGGRRALDLLIQNELEGPPGEMELLEHYERHAEEFSRPRQVHLLQLLVEDRKIAERARAEIAESGAFSEIALRYAADAGSVDQGFLDPLDLPPAFAEAVAGLEAAQVSEILATDYGFHLFQVVEVWEERLLSFDEARLSIRERLERERTDRALERLVQEAVGRYDLAIHERNLPFDYVPLPAL